MMCWVVFQASGYFYGQHVEWLAPPTMTPLAYAARRLWLLASGAEESIPPPPSGPVQCAVYTWDEAEQRAGALLGQSERMFKPSDYVAPQWLPVGAHDVYEATNANGTVWTLKFGLDDVHLAPRDNPANVLTWPRMGGFQDFDRASRHITVRASDTP